METAKGTDLPDLLEHLGYSVRRLGSRYHTTREMDSIRIKDRRTWKRYSNGTGGDAIIFLQEFCGKGFREAVTYLLEFNGHRARDSPAPRPRPAQPEEKPVFALPIPNQDQQNEALDALLTAESRELWSNLLYGNCGEIVAVALSQVGNVGGQPYWSWYGFNSRVEWCACFVSWCANECGYIDARVIPKFAGCTGGSNWFKERGQWQDGSYEPRPGDLIFFDWDEKGSSGPQDDVPDHVGIVERVENGVVYTVEGNSSDSCRQRSYNVGYYEIWVRS